MTGADDFDAPLAFNEDTNDIHFNPLQLADLADSPVPGYIIAADVNGDPIWVPPDTLVHGTNGTNGRDGAQGPPGFGERGSKGWDGVPGDRGPKGAAGVAGVQGTPGPVVPGWEGPRGRQGYDGPTGERGPVGATGATGATGTSAPVDGWVDALETPTFNDSSHINVANGALYQKGDRFKFTQSATVKYFYVIGVSGNVLQLVGSTASITVANSAISAFYYSRQLHPLNFPLFQWTPGYTGFSAAPITGSATFLIVGSVCYLFYTQTSLGTSNASTFTITGAPVGIGTAIVVGPWHAWAVNNSANLTVPIRVDMSGTTITFGSDINNINTWTSSGTKGVYGLAMMYTF